MNNQLSLLAGAAKVVITDEQAGPANDPLYAKALVLKSGETTTVLATVDAVAIAEIGSIQNSYLETIRSLLVDQSGIDPAHIIVNASHCHGHVCADVAERTVQAVKEAHKALVPVCVGVGTGHEDGISENRRMKLKNGKDADVRHAYALPPDEEVESVGKIDPEIGVLRLNRINGETLAVVYNFAVHPILGVPSGKNTADITGFASQAIEDVTGDGAIALFVQGATGDVNPIWYKDVDHPRDAKTLGNALGLSTLKALGKIQDQDNEELKVIRETLQLPRADLSNHIDLLEQEQQAQLKMLKGTTLNLKTFVPLLIKHRLSPKYPTQASHYYLHEREAGREDLDAFDEENRRALNAYVNNIHTMEHLTRIQTNINLLKRHQARFETEGDTVAVEVVGLRIGNFVLVTFPGELSVEIGLGIKQRSPHRHTFVAGVTNGYIYYTPTEEQLKNRGYAQEDSDSMVAPGWQVLFEQTVDGILQHL